MLSIPYKKEFTQSILWNLLDSVGTQGLLIIHHILLRIYSGTEFHGIFGAMLSIFYLSLIIINFGLDYSFAPFYKSFTHSKLSARLLFYNYLLPQIVFLVVCAALFYNLYPALLNLFSTNAAIIMKSNLNPFLVQVISLSLIFESLKKTIKHLLQLSFKTKITAYVEFFGMASYMAIIWGAYFSGIPISLNLSWAILLMQSVFQFVLLSIVLVYQYRKLPDLPPTHTQAACYFRFSASRLFTFINQLLGQLFSGNFLVPLCAFYLGFEQASFLKVITSITYWITLVAQKVFGISTSAVLANAKNMEVPEQRSLFIFLSSYFYQALYGLIIFLLINGKKIAMLHSINFSPTLLSWSTLYLMLLISFCESFFIIYEKWYIIQEKIAYLFSFNALSFAILYFILNHTPLYYAQISQLTFFILIICVRMLMLLLLTLFSYRRWQIWPSFKINRKALITSLIISLSFYFLI